MDTKWKELNNNKRYNLLRSDGNRIATHRFLEEMYRYNQANPANQQVIIIEDRRTDARVQFVLTAVENLELKPEDCNIGLGSEVRGYAFEAYPPARAISIASKPDHVVYFVGDLFLRNEVEDLPITLILNNTQTIPNVGPETPVRFVPRLLVDRDLTNCFRTCTRQTWNKNHAEYPLKKAKKE